MIEVATALEALLALLTAGLLVLAWGVKTLGGILTVGARLEGRIYAIERAVLGVENSTPPAPPPAPVDLAELLRQTRAVGGLLRIRDGPGGSSQGSPHHHATTHPEGP